MNFHFSPIKIVLFIIALAFAIESKSQVADLTLSMTQFMSWTTPSNQSNVSLQPMQSRVKKNNFQLNNSLDTNTRILYCPDGMNNFGPYIDSANQFNLFNFSHWQYIDILCWFGGTASDPVTLPAKAWVDAAHKNGVKVIGTVFFAPIVYGGSQSQVQSFLQTDSQGNFIAIKQLKDIANYYNFDGWIFNCETPVTSTIAGQIATLVAQLDTAYAGDVIWYDSMLQSGNISYQNRLNANNAYFFTHSEGLFTNYAWSSANTVTSSQTYANSISQSPYKVYTGADIWPTRNAQPAFSNYQWIDKIITNNVAKTSIALFATNFTYNYAGFSNFNNDSTDYQNFYDAENKIFSGLDLTPFATDATWKGIANYLPVRTTIRSFPFSTNFNTGHGLDYYHNGVALNTGSWHNMSVQSTLPSWTFFNTGVTIKYNFTDAFNGGSSLNISSSSAIAGSYNIPLFSTSIITSQNSLNALAAMKMISGSIDSLSILIKRKNNSDIRISLDVNNSQSWNTPIGNKVCNISDTLIAMSIEIKSSGAFQLLFGQLDVNESMASNIADQAKQVNNVVVYPNPSNGSIQFRNLPISNKTILRITDLSGKVIKHETLQGQSELHLQQLSKGLYFYEVSGEKKYFKGTFIVE